MSANSPMFEAQLANLSILQSMFPLESELTLDAPTQTAADEGSPSAGMNALRVTLSMKDELDTLETLVTFPLDKEEATYQIRQPTWLSRTEVQMLQSFVDIDRNMGMPDGMVETILGLQEAVGILLDAQKDKASKAAAAARLPSPEVKEKLERVWFWFPSLSSKEKRRDLVEYGINHGLTGFVLAGKPGLLCVEGDGHQVDRYMSKIKSESWRDIPPSHKKVTERLRRPLKSNTDRLFASLTDVTDLVPKYGQYAHRGEMSEVKRLMEAWGVGDDFGIVVMNHGS